MEKGTEEEWKTHVDEPGHQEIIYTCSCNIATGFESYHALRCHIGTMTAKNPKQEHTSVIDATQEQIDALVRKKFCSCGTNFNTRSKLQDHLDTHGTHTEVSLDLGRQLMLDMSIKRRHREQASEGSEREDYDHIMKCTAMKDLRRSIDPSDRARKFEELENKGQLTLMRGFKNKLCKLNQA
jgi:hypothetical protein